VQGLTDPRVLVLGSLRADYFDRLQADVLFTAYEHVNVPPLTRTQLEDVVAGPARALAVDFEDERLPLRIVEAAAAEPGALPLLSYLLTDMWTAMVQHCCEPAVAKRASRQKAIAFASLSILGLIAALGGPWAYSAFNKERMIDHEAARTDVRGEIVAYAVVAGGRALDTAPGLQTSPYTTPLVAKLHQKDKSLIEAIQDAHEEVISLTAGGQRPSLSTSMNGLVYLWQQPQSRSKRAVVVSVDDPGAPWNRLIAPRHDADAVAGVLQEVGFTNEEVTRLHNVNKADIEEAANRACQDLKEHEPPQGSSGAVSKRGLDRSSLPPSNTLVIFYFSGHGFEIAGENFLMPTIGDSPFKTEKDAQLVGVRLESLRQVISDCSAASVFILDTHFPEISRQLSR
jgi:Caspase domain